MFHYLGLGIGLHYCLYIQCVRLPSRIVGRGWLVGWQSLCLFPLAACQASLPSSKARGSLNPCSPSSTGEYKCSLPDLPRVQGTAVWYIC